MTESSISTTKKNVMRNVFRIYLSSSFIIYADGIKVGVLRDFLS
jgi:hypothetical protein